MKINVKYISSNEGVVYISRGCNHRATTIEHRSIGYFNGKDYHEVMQDRLICKYCKEVLEDGDDIGSDWEYED